MLDFVAQPHPPTPGFAIDSQRCARALAISIALQHGVPLNLLCEKFEHTRFEPSGWTQNPDIGYAKSVMDYIFRWLHLRFLSGQQQTLFEGLRPKSPVALSGPQDIGPEMRSDMSIDMSNRTGVLGGETIEDILDLGDSPTCQNCGSIMVRNGSCYKCMNCGNTSGCS